MQICNQSCPCLTLNSSIVMVLQLELCITMVDYLYIHCLQVVNMMRNLCVIVTKIAIGGLTSVREEIERGREGPKSEIGREKGAGGLLDLL